MIVRRLEAMSELSCVDSYLGALSCDLLGGCSANLWIKMTEGSAGSVEYSTVGAYAFAAAIRVRDISFAPVIAGTFEQVHAALAAGLIPSDVTARLSQYLVSIARSFDWDMCERMRRSLMLLFVEDAWPAQWLFVTVRDVETLSRVLAFARSTKRGRRWLDRVVNDVERRRLDIDTVQYRTLHLAAAS
jgi:hypothetical protein